MDGLIFALLFAIMLGSGSIFSRKGLEHGSYRELLVISLVISSFLFLSITALTTGFSSTPPIGALYAAIGGIVGSVVGRSLYFIGIRYLGPGKSLSISALSPLGGTFLAWLILDESITALVVIGTVGVVVGIAILSKDIRSETDSEDYSIAVVFYPLGGAALAAVALTFRKIALNLGLAPIEGATVNMVAGLVILTPLMATRWRSELLDIHQKALINFSIASTFIAVGILFYFIGLQRTNASIFYPIAQTQPLFAVLLSAIFLSRLEIITRWSIIGSSVIVAGVSLVVIG